MNPLICDVAMVVQLLKRRIFEGGKRREALQVQIQQVAERTGADLDGLAKGIRAIVKESRLTLDSVGTPAQVNASLRESVGPMVLVGDRRVVQKGKEAVPLSETTSIGQRGENSNLRPPGYETNGRRAGKGMLTAELRKSSTGVLSPRCRKQAVFRLKGFLKKGAFSVNAVQMQVRGGAARGGLG